MRTMIDLGSQRGPIVLHIMDTATSVDCGRQVRFRRTFRSLVECMVPACCAFQPTLSDSSSLSSSSSSDSDFSNSFNSTTTHTHASTVTGTFFGFRRGRVSFCLQDDTKNSPLLLLELGIPTSYLAKEMQYGLLRIALVECERFNNNNLKTESGSLFGVALWSVFFNGKKVGFARRQATAGDVAVLKLMQSVSVGAGVLPAVGGSVGQENGGSGENDQMMYLRARFERVGSMDSESFHMINPDGTSSGQELCIFLLRS